MLNVLVANVRKVAIEMLRYLPNTISSVVTFYAIFLMFFLGVRAVAGPEAQAENIQYTIVSTVLWILALMAMQSTGWEITTEATRGTLEQMYMSPVGAWRILLSRMLGTVLVNLLIVALVLFLAMLTSGQWLNLDLLSLAPLLGLLLLGMIGVGFMVAGLALLFKQINAFLQIAQFIFFALVAVPVGLTPWLELLPAVRGSSMIRTVMVEGVSLTAFTTTDWLFFAGNAALYFGAGIIVYKFAEHRAMAKGLLGQY